MAADSVSHGRIGSLKCVTNVGTFLVKKKSVNYVGTFLVKKNQWYEILHNSSLCYCIQGKFASGFFSHLVVSGELQV